MKTNNDASALLLLQITLILLKLTNVQPISQYNWLSIFSLLLVPMVIGTGILIYRKIKLLITSQQ
jgi:ABC-type multidrug transport system permease subunit